jgi:hypothetical protein
VGFVWLGKAAVQATLAPVALDLVKAHCAATNQTGSAHCNQLVDYVIQHDGKEREKEKEKDQKSSMRKER